MPRRAITRRTHRASASNRGTGVPSTASYSPSIAPRLHEEIDQTLGRWWRATRIVRRLNTVAKN
jgi:hypothetical protein